MPTDSIEAHGNELMRKIPEVAEKLGVRQVHLVAHSKGGLDARMFIELLSQHNPSKIKVLSLTTLSTPHQGSVGADYLIDANNSDVYVLGSETLDIATRTVLARLLNLLDGTTADDKKRIATLNLRVLFVRDFNERIKMRRSIFIDGKESNISYVSFSADANSSLSSMERLPNNPLIDYSDLVGTGYEDKINQIGYAGELSEAALKDTLASLFTVLYRLMGEVEYTELITKYDYIIIGDKWVLIREHPTANFEYNDFLVTARSARGVESGNLFSERPAVKANHATIARPDTALDVIDHIRSLTGLPRN